MTFRPWRAAAVLAPAAIAAAALATPAAAAASPSWQFTDQYTASPACFTTSGGTEPLELNLNGTWSTSLTFGASGLPAGASSSDMILDENLTNDVWSSANPPIPPGWSNGTGPLAVGPETIAEAYAETTIPPASKRARRSPSQSGPVTAPASRPNPYPSRSSPAACVITERQR